MFKKEICYPITALSLLSLGGWMFHIRIHPPSAEATINWLPTIIGFITTFVLPFMFSFASTARWAFLITIIAIVGGTITMADYSFDNPPQTITLLTILLETTLGDIIILFAKLPIALSILQYWRKQEKIAS
jgi:hypothetical protein